MKTIARFCFTNKWLVIGIWVVLAVGLTVIEESGGSAYSNSFTLPNTDSFNAIKLLERDAPSISGDTDQIVMESTGGKLTDPQVSSQISAVLAKVKTLPDVGGVSNIKTIKIAPGGKIGLATVTFDKLTNDVGDANSKLFVNTVRGSSTSTLEFEVEGQVAEQGAQDNTDKSAAFGFFATAIVLFLVFGSVPAMLLPLLTAGAALAAGIGVIGLLTHVITIAPFSDQLALLIGIGVGVDYALFIVTRFRQAILRGRQPVDAAVEAIDTSGRAVLFAGTIVAIAMLGMFALGVSFLYGVAIAAAVAVAFTVVAALTLLPALMSLFGVSVLVGTIGVRKLVQSTGGVLRGRPGALGDLRDAVHAMPWFAPFTRFVFPSAWRAKRRAQQERFDRLLARSTGSDASSAWTRWTNTLQRLPWLLGGAAAIVLVVLTIPFFGMRLGQSDAGTDPTTSTTYKAYNILAKGFGPGYNGTFTFVAEADTPAQKHGFALALKALKKTPGFVNVSPRPIYLPPVNGHQVGEAFGIPAYSPQDARTADLLHTIRDTVIPNATAGSGVHVLVGGSTAIFDDFARILSNKLPLFLVIVIGLSFLLLMVVFRSVAVPLTAAIMNMLSAGAAFGIVTAVFQNGTGASLIGVDTKGPIEAFLPVIVFPIVFGLSMDYEVFLLSRIHEEWVRRGDNREAVTHGLAATGRTITAAAAIMVLVFGGFVLGGQRVIQLFGVGLASAVLLDALLVRCVLVPSLMLLLGKRNWQIPAVLDRILPRLNVEGGAEPEPAPART